MDVCLQVNVFLAEQALVTRVRMNAGDETTLGGTPDLVVFNKTRVRGKCPSVNVYDWKAGNLTQEEKSAFEAGCRDNKLGAVYYQMNLYAYMLETELSVSVSNLHAVFFGQRCVETYLLPRANSSDVVGWIARTGEVRTQPPVPHTRFTESSQSEQRLEPAHGKPISQRASMQTEHYQGKVLGRR